MKNHGTNPKSVRLRRHGEARLERAERLARAKAMPTRRELDVLRAYIAAGSMKEAAVALALNESTVEGHLANIRAKTGTATTAQAIWFLRDQLGVVDLPG